MYDMQNPTTVYPRLEIVQQKLVPDEFVMRQSANADDGCLGRPRPWTGSCKNFEEEEREREGVGGRDQMPIIFSETNKRSKHHPLPRNVGGRHIQPTI